MRAFVLRGARRSLARWRASRCFLALQLFAVSFFAACAAEAPPRPPRIQAPQPVTNLTVAQIGHNLALRFAAPRFAADGRRLTKPIEVEIFREVSRHGPVTEDSFNTVKPWAVLNPAALHHATSSGTIRYLDRLSPSDFSRFENSTFSFMVVTLTRGFRGHPRLSDPSNIAQTKLLPVPAAIEGVEARQTRGAIELQWRSPTLSTRPGPSLRLRGYAVLRATRSAPNDFTELAETITPSYRDVRFRFGTSYIYVVRATFSEGGYTAETADSSPVYITPHPIFPPPSPSGLRAVFTGSEVDLSWMPVSEADIAGYNVYRRTRGAAARKLNQEPVKTTVYTDSTALPGKSYVYWVTSVDLHHNESQPSAEARVETR